MSEIQNLAPHIQKFPSLVRKARTDKGLTNEELAEISGVSYSAVCKVQSGERDPKLYDAVAIMKAIGLSADQAFDIQQPDTAPSAMQERIHKLELGNAVSAGDVERLTQVNDLYQVQLDDLREQKNAYRHWALFSTIFSAVLSLFLIAYLWFDFRIPNDGFIRQGDFTLVAWVIVFLLVISFCYIGITAYKIVKSSPTLTRAK
ncbi:MAG: helix-turn-helix transcriptional regulator [bacterium]|nr:helix-turn-helix transcriptional regulator [bacterium]